MQNKTQKPTKQVAVHLLGGEHGGAAAAADARGEVASLLVAHHVPQTIAREDQYTVRRPQRHVDRVWLHAQPRCKRQIPKPEARQMLSLCGVASGTGRSGAYDRATARLPSSRAIPRR